MERVKSRQNDKACLTIDLSTRSGARIGISMRFYRKLYTGKSIADVRRVKWKLRVNAGQMNLYVIALCKGRDQLEIYHCAYLQQKFYRKYPPFIIGIANGYEEALEIVEQIAKEAYESNGDCNLKKYLRDRQ